MRKAPLYSRSPRPAAAPVPEVGATPAPSPSPQADASAQPRAASRFSRRERFAWAAIGLLLVLLGVASTTAFVPDRQLLTQKDIDASVRRSLEKDPLPSAYAKAYGAIRSSVVLVQGDDDVEDGPPPSPAKARKNAPISDPEGPPRASRPRHRRGDRGQRTILTNCTWCGSRRRKSLRTAANPRQRSWACAQHDLAVLRAKTIPDDLQAATSAPPAPRARRRGDRVGFPFGSGLRCQAAWVSGLKREFAPPRTRRKLTNLIQFDAAANPAIRAGRWSPWTAAWWQS